MNIKDILIEVTNPPGAAEIDQWLPQTQCTLCGYPRCREYAHALTTGEADINQCPPGGEITISGLAQLLNVQVKPLNPENGEHKARHGLIIDEQTCIGCTLCIQVCPVDAIIGASKLMHTIIEDHCTGCDLCIPVCPVDCIEVIPYRKQEPEPSWIWPEYSPDQTANSRRRTERRIQRLFNYVKTRQLKDRHIALRRNPDAGSVVRADIEAAVARANKS